MSVSPSEDPPIVPPFGDPNQALFNCTGNLSPEVADPSELIDQSGRRVGVSAHRLRRA